MSQQITINEELLNGGFEMTRSYKHDEFVTCTFKRLNSNFYIELTYEGSELVSIGMVSGFILSKSLHHISVLAQFLNANNL